MLLLSLGEIIVVTDNYKLYLCCLHDTMPFHRNVFIAEIACWKDYVHSTGINIRRTNGPGFPKTRGF